jgi:hypothetical protein
MRLMGRTRTNKIVVFPPSPRLRQTGSRSDELIGELVDVRIERANGFSLYGTPLLKDPGTFQVASTGRRVENSPAVRRDESAVAHFRRQ